MTESTIELVKHPDITIKLVGVDSNAFRILARCSTAMRKAGIKDQYQAFRTEATSGDYNHLISTVMRWFKVE